MRLGQINQNHVSKIAFKKSWFPGVNVAEQAVEVNQAAQPEPKPNWVFASHNNSFTIPPDPTPIVERSITTIIKTCAKSIGKMLPKEWEFKFPDAKTL